MPESIRIIIGIIFLITIFLVTRIGIAYRIRRAATTSCRWGFRTIEPSMQAALCPHAQKPTTHSQAWSFESQQPAIIITWPVIL